VLGSNQRSLSRRFYSPILLFEAYVPDLPLCVPRRYLGPPPSAMRPWVPGFGVRAVDRPSQAGPRTATDQLTDGGGKGHGQGRWERLCRPSFPFLAFDLPFQEACVGVFVLVTRGASYVAEDGAGWE
jgi:hypothetical protein